MRRFASIAALLAACSSSDPGFVGEVPTNPDALPGWLVEGRYSDWDRESELHATSGPHGDKVRTYLNLPLVASLEGDTPTNGRESAAVKELYDKGLLVGWAMMVKTEDGADGDSWYWFEMLDRDKPDAVFEGQGLAVCSSCHAAGRDFVRTVWPE